MRARPARAVEGFRVTTYLTTLPTSLVVLIVTSASIVISVGGLLAVRRAVPHAVLREHNDVAGFIFAALGVIYAVILAFVVIAVWENFENDRTNVNLEASSAINLYRESAALATEDREPIVAALQGYLVAVAEEEWPLMEDGQSSIDAERGLDTLWQAVHAAAPPTDRSSPWYEAMIDSLKSVTALREIRIDSARESLPPVMGFVLLAGGAITVAYTYLYGVRNLYGQIAMTVALASTLAITISIVMVLDAPFRGETAIGPEPIHDVLRTIAGSGTH